METGGGSRDTRDEMYRAVEVKAEIEMRTTRLCRAVKVGMETGGRDGGGGGRGQELN